MPELTALHIADPPKRWEALGFTVERGVCELGGVGLQFGGQGSGITSWAIEGIDGGIREIDGLPTTEVASLTEPSRSTHPNGATGIDHVVITTPDFDRTASVLEQSGLGLRRIRDAGGFRQGFRRIGPAILELVEALGAPPSPARFWGLVVIVDDLQRLKERLRDHLGEVRPAVQPGRQITTLKPSAGLSPKVAFMDPEP